MEEKRAISEILVNILRHSFKKARQEDLLEIAIKLQDSAPEIGLPENMVIREFNHAFRSMTV